MRELKYFQDNTQIEKPIDLERDTSYSGETIKCRQRSQNRQHEQKHRKHQRSDHTRRDFIQGLGDPSFHFLQVKPFLGQSQVDRNRPDADLQRWPSHAGAIGQRESRAQERIRRRQELYRRS